MSSPQSEDSESVYISSFTLNVGEELGRPVDHIVLQNETGTFKKELPVQVLPGHKHDEVFDPAVELSVQDRLSVSMQYPSRWKGARTPCVTVELSDIMAETQGDTPRNQASLFKLHKNIEVAIGVSRYSTASAPLLPTPNEIHSIVPRFRLLAIGNTGVGKSTLINSVFGVKDVDVSEGSRGRADIDREFVSPNNRFFVLHDSVGLEAAEGNNYARVKQFVGDRRKKEKLEDRLHAVWVLLPVPYAKGRLLEAGMEEFLRNRREILGDLPIVVVLTKLDLLDNALMMELRGKGVMFRSIAEAKPHLESPRSAFLNEYCTKSLVRAAGSDIPHVAVSTKSGYRLEPTISELVKTTITEVERSLAVATEWSKIERDALLNISRMALRPTEAKMNLTIAVAKKRYRTNLRASFNFSADKVKEYLLAVHDDIIRVWNFDDPQMALQNDSFKEALLDTSNLGVTDVPSGQPVYKLFKSPETIAKCFMAYIVDLTYVMKILFILVLRGPVTSQDVPLALEVYKRSTYRNRVHLEIRDFNTNFVTGRDAVLDKIEVVIRRYSITDEDVSLLRSQIARKMWTSS